MNPAPGPPVSRVGLTVDAEEWFHIPGRSELADPEKWDHLPATFPRALDETLSALDEGGWRATFFVLGWLARRYPLQVRRIADSGHEVACHGFEHRLVGEMTRDAFRKDVRAAKDAIEEASGQSLAAFRAPRWSIPREVWPYEILAGEGFTVSSSRLCIPGLGVGDPAPRMIAGVLELPALSAGRGFLAWPAGGTITLRVVPLSRLRLVRDRALAEGRPAIYWFHPWELLSGAPRIEGSLPFRWSRYSKLHRLPGRLKALVPPGDRTIGALVDSGGVGYPMGDRGEQRL